MRLEAIGKTRLTWDDSPPPVCTSPEGRGTHTCDEPAPGPRSGRDGAGPGERLLAVERTHQPKARNRAKTDGFRKRMSSRAGRAILKSRRLKGRHRLTV